jgi:Peptidase family M28
VPPTETISRLLSFGPRWPGMAGERRAAEHLASELERIGREVEVEPIRVRPAYHLTHALHAAIAVVGNVVSVYVPPLGVAILLLAATSMYGDLSTRFYLLRRLFPRRLSQNVTSPGSRPDAPARVVLTAHCDSARSGLIFNRRRRPPPRPVRALSTLAGPIDVVFWTIAAALVLALVRLFAGYDAGEATALTIAQFVDTVILMVAFALFVDVALSDPVPGASDNASGAAAVLEVARRLALSPPANLDVWIVFTGAKEGLMLGMREWMRAHEEDIDPRRTFFVNVDNVGAGTVRPVSAEGFLIIYRHDQRLIELASEAGTTALERSPYLWRLGTDGTLPAMRGVPSITICATDRHGRIPNFHRQSDTVDQIEPASVERAIELAELLVRRIDDRLIPALLPSFAPAG